VTDLRRGVLVRSEDQEEELVSTAFISGLASSGTSRGEKVAVGGSNGVVTLWEKGAWDDQDERIYVGGAEAIETLTTVPDFLGKGKMLAAGLGNGLIKFIRVGQNKVSSEVVHDETEGVVGLGFDVEGRMVSGGGQIVKVWHDAVNTSGGDSMAGEKHMLGDSDDSDDDSDDSDAEERRTANANERKKRKKGKSGRGTGPDVMAFDMD
jgi:hypothetical protein